MSSRLVDQLVSAEWRFAKTMPKLPHWYSLRETWDDAEFEHAVKYIRRWGYKAEFFGKTYIYLNSGAYKYWTMNEPIAKTTLINRDFIKWPPRIIIRALPDRPYLDYLREKLPKAEWCFDETHNAMDTFLKAMRMAGNDPALHLEDDIILTQDFEAKANQAILEHPDNIIQFFSMRQADVTEGSRWDSHFTMNQCYYLPYGYAEQLSRYYLTWPQRKKHPTGYDIMIDDWLKTRKEKHWIHVPSLVEHRIGKSAIDPRRSSKRQSKTFKEAT